MPKTESDSRFLGQQNPPITQTGSSLARVGAETAHDSLIVAQRSGYRDHEAELTVLLMRYEEPEPMLGFKHFSRVNRAVPGTNLVTVPFGIAGSVMVMLAVTLVLDGMLGGRPIVVLPVLALRRQP
jgi:hypothetical protein